MARNTHNNLLEQELRRIRQFSGFREVLPFSEPCLKSYSLVLLISFDYDSKLRFFELLKSCFKSSSQAKIDDFGSISGFCY